MAYAGCLAGTFFGSLLASYVDLSYKGQSLMALACASLVPWWRCSWPTDDRMLTHLLDTDSERPVTPRRFMLRVEEAAQTHGLTAKETEVLVLAARGRTTQRICEELGISTGTANTHLAHIYKKFDVHDRQQLIDILENVEQIRGGPRSCMFYRGIKLSATNPKKGPRQCLSMPHRIGPNPTP